MVVGRRLIFVVLVAAMVASTGSFASLPADEAERVLAEASDHFRSGAGLVDSDREAGRRELERAIAGFERLIHEGGARNGGLYYNIGNCHLLLGDIGRAVLNFRRAERLTPGDPNLSANLSYARQRVPNRFDAPAPERVRRALFFWHDESRPATRWTVFIIVYSLGWGLALLRLTRWVAWGGWWPGVACLIVAGSTMASLVFDHREAASRREAVIVAAEAVGRKGPDARAYEPSFKEPLRAGVEGRIIERRPGWMLLRLADGRETWLESSALEMVGE